MENSQKDVHWGWKIFILITFILFAIAISKVTKNDIDKELSYYPQEDNNSCWDLDANLEWEILIAKYPRDTGVHILYSLRIGLCFEVERNKLTTEQATDIFESVRISLIKSRMEQKLFENLNKKKKV